MAGQIDDMNDLRNTRRAAWSLLRHAPVWLAILGLAAVAGYYAEGHQDRVLMLAALLLFGTLSLYWATRPDVLANHRWIPYAWIALALAPDHRFQFHSTDPSLSNLSPENIAQAVIYAVVAGLVLHARRMLVSRDRRTIRTGPLMAWPLFALASTIWSLVPLFTFVRALQLFVPIGLAIVMVRLWLDSPERAAELWRETLRRFVGVVTLLILVGFALGFWRDFQFSWPGAHPGTAGMYIAGGLMILLAAGNTFLGLRRSGYVFRVLLFAFSLYLGEARGVLAGVLVGLGVMLWYFARQNPLKSYIGLTYYVLAIGLVLLAASPELLQYALKGGTIEGITSLDGRIPLWTQSIELLSNGGKWLFGFGYGSARILLPKYFYWAGTAHSSWVEWLMAGGVLGLLLASADILFLAWRSSSRRSLMPPALTMSLIALLVVVSTASEGLSFPGVMFTMVAFLHAPVLAEWNSRRLDQVSLGFAQYSRGAASAVRPTRSLARRYWQLR